MRNTKELPTYCSQKELAALFSCHPDTVRRNVKEMETYVGEGKHYPPRAIHHSTRCVRIDLNFYCDFVRNRKLLARGLM